MRLRAESRWWEPAYFLKLRSTWRKKKAIKGASVRSLQPLAAPPFLRRNLGHRGVMLAMFMSSSITLVQEFKQIQRRGQTEKEGWFSWWVVIGFNADLSGWLQSRKNPQAFKNKYHANPAILVLHMTGVFLAVTTCLKLCSQIAEVKRRFVGLSRIGGHLGFKISEKQNFTFSIFCYIFISNR